MLVKVCKSCLNPSSYFSSACSSSLIPLKQMSSNQQAKDRKPHARHCWQSSMRNFFDSLRFCDRYSHSGVDLMRLNHARHAFATLICDTLHQAGASYSMPSFSGPRHPSSLLATESSRPLSGSQASFLLADWGQCATDFISGLGIFTCLTSMPSTFGVLFKYAWNSWHVFSTWSHWEWCRLLWWCSRQRKPQMLLMSGLRQ